MPKAIGNLARGSTVQKSLRLLLPLCVLQAILAIVLGWI
jgi:K+-transporting ATPase A subunit